MSFLRHYAILFVLIFVFAFTGCKSEDGPLSEATVSSSISNESRSDSNSQSPILNPHFETPTSPHNPDSSSKEVVDLINGSLSWTGYGPLFSIDSKNNVYIFSGGSGYSTPSTGFIKIDSNGINTYFLNGWMVNFLARDSEDNLYLFVFVPNNSGGISSPEIIIFAANGSISSYCKGCIPASWSGAVVSSGNLLVVGTNSKSIDVITPSGIGRILAGANVDSATCEDGVGTSARFKGIAGMAIDSSGNVFVLDGIGRTGMLSCASKIRKISPDGVVTTVYTLPVDESETGMGLAIDEKGNLYYAASKTGIIKVTQDGVASRYCGGTTSSNIMQSGSCSSVFIWYSNILGFNSAGDLIFYEIDTSIQPHQYRLFSIIDSP